MMREQPASAVVRVKERMSKSFLVIRVSPDCLISDNN